MKTNRRTFVLWSAGLAVSSCAGMVGAIGTDAGSADAGDPDAGNADGGNPDGGSDAGADTNHAPIWQVVPDIMFVEGVASSFSVAALASDEDHDALTLLHNGAQLPAGVTYDATNRRFVYDGIGAAASTSGHQLTADDSR